MLFGTLGAGVPDRAPTAGRIADAHHVIRELPVVAVHHVEHAGSSPHSTSEADYTVRLPVPGGGRGVAATFRTEVQRGVRDVGETLVVAYAPEHPDVGAVGATTTSAVEAQLSGRPLAHGDALIVGILWALTAVVAVGSATAVTGPPRRSRRVDARWGALRAVATGVAEHVERPSHDDSGAEAGADSGADSGAKKSPPRYACLILRTETGEVPLRLTATHKSAGPLLTGAEGWLLWDPAGSRGKVPADFVADDGWQLPGRIPRDKAARLAPAPPHEPLPLDAARRPHLLELGSQWTRTVPLGALFGLLLSLAAAGALLLPVDGGWRTWTAAAGVLAPLVARLLSERSTTPPAEKDT
ncbi:hypothetical protein ACFCVY_17765 [Streptomyces sp. NPDC056411]|uniref:hypothetical protein n=1 Tax=Streptomyces sp. NPDC056411 TaxID=3345813 RepID=UPI0035E1FE33